MDTKINYGSKICLETTNIILDILESVEFCCYNASVKFFVLSSILTSFYDQCENNTWAGVPKKEELIDHIRSNIDIWRSTHVS